MFLPHYLSGELLEETKRLLSALRGEHGHPVLGVGALMNMYRDPSGPSHLICVGGPGGRVVVASVKDRLTHLIATAAVGLLGIHKYKIFRITSKYSM